MKEQTEKKFEQALGKEQVTGAFELDKQYILDIRLEQKHFKDLTIINGSLTCSLFQNCQFTNVLFESVHLDNCDFQNCHFENVTFKNCTTDNIQFNECQNLPQIT